MFVEAMHTIEISIQNPEDSARQIADQFPYKSTVRLSNQPFPLQERFLKSLQVHFEREKLPSRHNFVCQIEPGELSLRACEILSALNFSQLDVSLELATDDFSGFERFFEWVKHFSFKVSLSLHGEPSQTSMQHITRIYFFLRQHLGLFALNYSAGWFENVRVDRKFNQLAITSQEIHAGRLFDGGLQEQFYQVMYEFLHKTLSSRVKTILEINPYADLHYYKNFNRMGMPWQITLSPIHQGQIDLKQLQSLGKTFDAVVLFQAMPYLRDPQRDILLLQNYTRATTEWTCVQYNMQSFPMLAQLLNSRFHNTSQRSAHWNHLRMHSRKSIESLFHFLGIDFQWIATRVPIEDLRGLKSMIEPIFEPELKEKWHDFVQDSDVMAWTAYGTMKQDEDVFEADGFVSGGFL